MQTICIATVLSNGECRNAERAERRKEMNIGKPTVRQQPNLMYFAVIQKFARHFFSNDHLDDTKLDVLTGESLCT